MITYINFIDACGFHNQPDYLHVIVQDITRKYLAKQHHQQILPPITTDLKSIQEPRRLISNPDIPLCLNTINSLIEAYTRVKLYKHAVLIFDLLEKLNNHFRAIGDEVMYREMQLTPKTVLSFLGLLRSYDVSSSIHPSSPPFHSIYLLTPPLNYLSRIIYGATLLANA